MKAPAIFRTGVVLIFLSLVGQATPAWSSQTAATVTETIQLKQALEWRFETDIGTMHFYADGELWSVDLMKEGRILSDPVPLSGIKDVRGVRHISKTNLLFVASAVSGLTNAASDGPSSDTATVDAAMASCLIDLLSGTILWKQPALAIPDEIHHFAMEKVLILRSIPGGRTTSKKAAKVPSKFTAVDLETGAVLWEREYLAQAVRANGSSLEIVGRRTVSLDAVSGNEVRIVDLSLPPKTMLMAFPEQNTVLTWQKKNFALYDIPVLSRDRNVNPQLPVTIDARQVWQAEAQKKLGEASNRPGMMLGPKYVSDRMLLINFARFIEVLDTESGKSVWGRKKKLASIGQDLEVSPDGSYGALTSGKKLIIVDMKTGLDHAEIKIPDISMFKAAFPRLMWQNSQELVLVFSDASRRPSSVSRINVEQRSILWTVAVPEPAKYRMTSSEKGQLAGRILLAVAMTAASASNPVVTGNTSTTYIFIPNLNVKVLPDSSAGLEAMDARLADLADTSETLALRRYVERSGMISGILGKHGLFVSGKEDLYQIYNFDMATGDTKVVAEYSAPNVHGIEPDVVYGLAIAEEENRKTIRILSIGDTPGW